MNVEFTGKGCTILDFDIEVRPLSWFGGDWVTKEVTVIAAQFTHQKKGHVWLLGVHEPVEMLEGFRKLYDRADMVAGHFIRGYDLPTLNSAMVEYGLPPLDDKLAHDTKLDLVRFSGLSKSQENLGAVLGLKHPKVQMDQAKWREANRLLPAGIKKARHRALGDVRQNIEMRQQLLDLGLLSPPKVWSGRTAGPVDYHP